MIDGWFKLGDHWSEEFQMFISSRPKKTKAKRMFSLDEVSGVNKLVISDKGYYTNAEQTIEAFYVSPNLESIQYIEDAITEALDTKGQYVDFIPYYDPAYIYSVVVINEPIFEGTSETLRGVPFSFDISVAPFKRRVGGDRSVSIYKPTSLYNPEKYSSNPKIKIYGKGDISLYINNRKTFLKDIEDIVIIDSDPDVMEVYKEDGDKIINLHSKFLSNQNFPYLDKGRNFISFEGNITLIEIEPRWQTKI